MKFYFNTILCGGFFFVCSLYPMQSQISNPFSIKQIPHYSPLSYFFSGGKYRQAAAMVLFSASFACLEISTCLDPNVREAVILDRTMNQEVFPFNELICMAFDYNKWFEDFSCYVRTCIQNRTN